MKHFDHVMRLCFLCALLVFVGSFCQKKTDKLTILAISSSRNYRPEFEITPPKEAQASELNTVFDQPYTYYGCGGQAYAFFSRDGKYVIKFFKQRLFRPSWILNHLPLPKFLHRYREKRNWKRSDKLARDYFSYKVAYEELQNETAVIYSHLNPTNYLQKKLEIIDRLSIHHFVDLDNFDFIVQRRAEKVYDRIDRLMSEGNVAEAKETIKQVFDLISVRAKKGFTDRDPNIRTNCGFFENRAIKIDVGRFVRSKFMQTKEGHNEEMLEITTPFKDWIATRHPSLLEAFQQHLEEILIK